MAQCESNLTVFYDGACPLCAREIGVYQRQRGAGRIRWVDVHGKAEADLPAGLDREATLRRFHVSRPDGTTLSGARAFAELWAGLPGLAWAGRLAKIAPVTAFLEIGYRGFLYARPGVHRLLSWRLRRKDG